MNILHTKKNIHIFFYCIAALLFFPLNSFAKNTTAEELYKYCQELEKGSVGKPFDKEAASICSGYMDGFNDSMLIVNTIGKVQFCIPRAIATSRNIRLLDEWIKQNPDLINTTTASVAMFAAMVKTFPCKDK